MNLKNDQNFRLSIDELKIESFVTSIENEMNMRLFGGFGSEEHPTHTEQTDDEHHFCTTIIC
jgi:hypothetical protein